MSARFGINGYCKQSQKADGRRFTGRLLAFRHLGSIDAENLVLCPLAERT